MVGRECHTFGSLSGFRNCGKICHIFISFHKTQEVGIFRKSSKTIFIFFLLLCHNLVDKQE